MQLKEIFFPFVGFVPLVFFCGIFQTRLKASASNPSWTPLPTISPSFAIEQSFVGFPQLDSIFTSGNTNQEKLRENITRNKSTHSGWRKVPELAAENDWFSAYVGFSCPI